MDRKQLEDLAAHIGEVEDLLEQCQDDIAGMLGDIRDMKKKV